MRPSTPQAKNFSVDQSLKLRASNLETLSEKDFKIATILSQKLLNQMLH